MSERMEETVRAIVFGLIMLILVLIADIVMGATLFEDTFNTYNDGDVSGQGDWNGSGAWDIQGTETMEGAKAIYNSTADDLYVTKVGADTTAGTLVFYFMDDERANWNTGTKGYYFRITHGDWGAIFGALRFLKDGSWYIFDEGTGTYIVSGESWDAGVWNSCEIEWNTNSDKKYRARINEGTWTDWYLIYGSASYAHFDYVGVDFYNTGGTGGIYVDYIAEELYVEEETTSTAPEIISNPEVYPFIFASLIIMFLIGFNLAVRI